MADHFAEILRDEVVLGGRALQENAPTGHLRTAQENVLMEAPLQRNIAALVFIALLQQVNLV